jgi:hypothetical protein
MSAIKAGNEEQSMKASDHLTQLVPGWWESAVFKQFLGLEASSVKAA